jgi:hypothetical protein
MDNISCTDEIWAEIWLEEHGHIAHMLAGGWTLETLQDMPFDEFAQDMMDAYEEVRQSHVSQGVKLLRPWNPWLTCCLVFHHPFRSRHTMRRLTQRRAKVWR